MPMISRWYVDTWFALAQIGQGLQLAKPLQGLLFLHEDRFGSCEVNIVGLL